MKKLMVIILVASFLVLASLSFVSAALFINSPESDKIYDSSKILFDIESDEVGDFYYMIGDMSSGKRWVNLCKNTDHCQKQVRLKNSSNSIQIKFINSEIEYEEDIQVNLDTKFPVILKTLLKSFGMISSSTRFISDSNKFIVIFKEENKEDIIIYYGMNKESAESETSDDCSFNDDKKWWECIFEDVDLSNYDNKEIIYWFEVIDEANHKSISSIKKVKVDITAPVIKADEVNYEVNKKKVNFAFEVDEENFAGVFYWDSNALIQKWIPLCNKLNSIGRCTATRSFSEGDHSLDIKVLDKAGNSDIIEDIEFTIN